MDRYERITALHRLLKAARYPVNVKRLQEELGCSRATVYRDLAFLRDGLMAPIVGDGEAGFLMGFAAYTPLEIEAAVKSLERALRAAAKP